MLHAQQRAENVGIEGGCVALGGLLRHRTGLAFGSGRVYSHVQTTEARHGLIDQVSYVVLVAYIGIHVLRLRVESAEFSHQILAGFVASARDNDARTLFREGQGGGSSNACEGASDQNNRCVHGILLSIYFLLSVSRSLTIHSRMYAEQFSNWMPSDSQLPRNRTASASTSDTSPSSSTLGAPAA